MSDQGDVIAARARGLVGLRFRPQGREPALGLDCVGTAAAAAGVAVRADYALRGDHEAAIEAGLAELGCARVAQDESEAGDVAVCRAGPAQFHLLVLTDGGFVHADAGLRRIVERPLPAPWPVLGVWRLGEGDS